MAFDRALAPLADAGNRPALTAAGDALAFAFVDVPVALAVFRRCVADDPTAAGAAAGGGTAAVARVEASAADARARSRARLELWLLTRRRCLGDATLLRDAAAAWHMPARCELPARPSMADVRQWTSTEAHAQNAAVHAFVLGRRRSAPRYHEGVSRSPRLQNNEHCARSTHRRAGGVLGVDVTQ